MSQASLDLDLLAILDLAPLSRRTLTTTLRNAAGTIAGVKSWLEPLTVNRDYNVAGDRCCAHFVNNGAKQPYPVTKVF